MHIIIPVRGHKCSRNEQVKTTFVKCINSHELQKENTKEVMGLKVLYMLLESALIIHEENIQEITNVKESVYVETDLC